MKKEIKKIQRILDDIGYAPKPPKLAKWTKAVKQQLAALGKKHGYEVAPDYKQSASRDKQEWLHDLTWWCCQNGARNNKTSIELTAASEWKSNIDTLKREFTKLVYARAKLKLFIFRAKNKAKCEEILSELKSLVDICEDKHNDKYLFSCFVEDDGEFIHYEGACAIETTVKVSPLHLQQ